MFAYVQKIVQQADGVEGGDRITFCAWSVPRTPVDQRLVGLFNKPVLETGPAFWLSNGECALWLIRHGRKL